MPIAYHMKRILWLLILSLFTCRAHCQTYYNADSLLSALSVNQKIAAIIQDAHAICKQTGIDTSDISVNAFTIAFLEKRMIDKRMIHIKHGRRYRNKKVIAVADLTKKGNRHRFAVIDVRHRQVLYSTLVSQGSGKGASKNDKYVIPTFFSNTINSEASSLGLVMTWKARQTVNPCHLCKYAISHKHKDVIILKGLENGINDNVQRRDIVMHTTGSADLSSADDESLLHIDDSNYHVSTEKCLCYHTGDDGKVKTISAYASACGIAENGGYIGQSDGCLVLPEDDHVAVMQTLKRKSLIFLYSDAISDGYSYFGDSPIIKKILRYAEH